MTTAGQPGYTAADPLACVGGDIPSARGEHSGAAKGQLNPAEPDGYDPRRARPGGKIRKPGERKEKHMWTKAHFKEALAS